jgi:hypothetical protein
MKDRYTSAEYRRMTGYNPQSEMYEKVNKEKIDMKSYKLSDSEKKIDCKQNKQPRKYHNRKVVFDGQPFDSEGEMKRWCELLILKRDGKITDLMRQIRFTVLQAETYHLSIHWIPDFVYKIDGVWCVEDFKSPVTEKKSDFRIKVKLFKKMYPDYLVYISTKKGVEEWK